MRVRGNAHQVFDKYQALAREAAASGDRILAEAYWQYADHYFRMIQTMGGFGQRNNQGWGDGGEEGQSAPQQQGQGGQPQQGNGNGHAQGERPGGREDRGDGEPGLDGVAFLQGGRGPPTDNDDPAADEQPEIPEFTPGTGRRG